MSRTPLRPRRPPPLANSIRAGTPEALLCRSVPHRRLLEEHRTAAPWCIKNQHQYLEGNSSFGATPLNAGFGATPLHLAAEQNLYRLAENVLAGGARVDLADSLGCTPLMTAAASGHPDVCVVLLKAGAACNAMDVSGKHPLHYAMSSAEGATEAVKLLALARADLGARDCHGATPLMVGAERDAAAPVEALLRLRASPLAVDRVGRTPLDYARGSRRCPESPVGAAVPFSPVRATKCYPRWDHLGASEVERLLLHEDRTLRQRTVPELSAGEMSRMRSGTPQLC